MDDNLPTEFDLIVVGTGFTESIIAAAASRIGKSVLHLDSNEFYGGYWASFNLENIKTLQETSSGRSDVEVNSLSDNCMKLSENLCRLVNVIQEFHVGDEESAGEENTTSSKWTKQKVMKDFRKFNIDVTPKLLFSRGSLVELLISSNICRYAEFRSVDRIATLINDELKTVPCSRSDVFTTKDVSVVEKRLLMKLMSTCLNYEAGSAEFKGTIKNSSSFRFLMRNLRCPEFDDKTFQEFLSSQKLTPNLQHYVLYAISMSENSTPFKEGLEKTNKFLSSLNRYGNTPFLYPMYGCGEIPQCFCRLCAVFGGVYCLKRSITEIFFRNDNDQIVFDAIQCDNQKIQAKNIVFGHGTISSARFETIHTSSQNQEKGNCGNLSRGIFVTDTPIGDESMNSGGGGVVFLKMHSTTGSGGGAFVKQLSHWSGCCPKDFSKLLKETSAQELFPEIVDERIILSDIVHITCQSSGTSAKSDLAEYVDKLFKTYCWVEADAEAVADVVPETPVKSPPRMLWSMYFNIPSCIKCEYAEETPIPGLHLSCGPYFELDYDKSIKDAKDLFTKIYPTEEFLPRAPDPDEIVIGDEDENVKLDIQEKMLVDEIENEVQCIEQNDLNESRE
ncbi:Rab proteins geranylgeranyltransferase component A [Pseudolycoriella hygida]|uniref:Rab proteins geranylgeranyltransferase component A n=1 Tax=Pseudolycoriella hygida TaxID=35572 RepID=A0A9Q0NHC4_9DIPT|nr:Rab proteins geranylgeranyltransferase component A [Pseudolycoriella hygida]